MSTQQGQIVKTSTRPVKSFMKWYIGENTKGVYTDRLYLTDAMTCIIGDKTIQCGEDSDQGLSHLQFIQSHQKETSTFTTKHGETYDYTVEFTIGDRIYIFATEVPAFDKIY